MRRIAIPCLLLSLGLALPAAAQVEIERRRAVPARGELSVDSAFGSITVTAWERAEVLVRGTLAAGAEELDFDVDKEGASVSIDVPEAWFHAAGEDAAFRSRLEIQAPAGWRVDVESVNATVAVLGFSGRIEASTINGPVTVDAPAESVEIETMTGAIQLLGQGAEVDLRTISGTIVARGVAGEVRVESVSGPVEVAGERLAKLEIETTSGAVEIRGAPAAKGAFDVQTFSGPVRVVLPKSVRTAFDVQSFGGAIQSDFCAGTPVVRERFEPFRQLRCSTGLEGFEIEIRTHDGDVTLAAE